MMSHLELMTDQMYSPSPLISFLEVASPLSSCCCCSVTQSCPALCDPMNCSTPAFPALQYLLDFAQTHVHQVRDAIQLSHPLLSLLLPALIFPSIRFFSNLSTLGIRWPEYWSFSFSISPYNEYSELILLRIEWLDLLAVQGTQESSPAPHFKASILWCSSFFMVQLSHLYMTTGKTIALTIWTFVSIMISAF